MRLKKNNNQKCSAWKVKWLFLQQYFIWQEYKSGGTEFKELFILIFLEKGMPLKYIIIFQALISSRVLQTCCEYDAYQTFPFSFPLQIFLSTSVFWQSNEPDNCIPITSLYSCFLLRFLLHRKPAVSKYKNGHLSLHLSTVYCEGLNT